MQNTAAETLALKALSYLAQDGEALLRFLNLSGLELENLRTRAGEPELLAAVMDFLLSEDALCATFLRAEKLEPQELHLARSALPGAARM